MKASVGHRTDILLVTTDSTILVGTHGGFTWIRCEGKGSFLVSPAMKEVAESRIAAGEQCLVVDLAACTGMDSTFMGTLAGMASRLSAGGKVQIAEPGDRNRRSLEDLGLDFLLEIDPKEAAWRGQESEIRATLQPFRESNGASTQRGQHVLEAHQILANSSEANAKKFSAVVQMLESELAAKQQQPPSEK